MKSLLYENLRDLMQKQLFEKITIKQICDQTGVIRATFYNYFEDKYDCLNCIVYHDIAEGMFDAMGKTTVSEALEEMLKNVEEHRKFYRIAYNVTGQNSFEDMIRHNLTLVFEEYLNRHRKPGKLEQYSNDLLSRYFAECVAFDIREFVFRTDDSITVKDTRQMIMDLMKTGLSDLLQTVRE